MKNTYESPLASRYASDEMLYIFSPDKKFSTWRRLWIALARAEKELGLTQITDEMIAEMEAHIDDINYDVAAEEEKKLRHDVMAHVHAYGALCPKAKGIIHLGATSCYVGDNTDIIIMRDAMLIIRKGLVNLIAKLSTVLSDRGINIENMGSRPRGEVAYTIMETNDELSDETKAALQAVEGVISFRVIE